MSTRLDPEQFVRDTFAITPKPRANVATLLAYQHEERLAQIAKPGRVGDAKVSFTRNAKGETQIAVEVGAPVGSDADETGAAVTLAYGLALAQYEAACQRFPAASGFVTNDGKGEAK